MSSEHVFLDNERATSTHLADLDADFGLPVNCGDPILSPSLGQVLNPKVLAHNQFGTCDFSLKSYLPMQVAPFV